MADPRKAIAKPVVKHAAPKIVKANTKLPESRKILPSKAQHRASGQVARDTKQVVAFGASKTRSGFVKSFDNPMAPRLKPKKSVVTYRHVLAAEFWVGVFVLLFEDTEAVGDPTSTVQPEHGRWIQLAAFIFTWAILFGITTGGTESARFSAALGGLILLTILVKKGDPFQMFGIFKDKSTGKVEVNAQVD